MAIFTKKLRFRLIRMIKKSLFISVQLQKFSLPVSALGLLQFDNSLFCCYLVSSISSPFRRLRQADHIAEGKARPQHRELHALLFSTSVWDLKRPTDFMYIEGL